MKRLLFALLVAAPLVATPAMAKNFIGDLVYCDANRDGVFGPGDYPLNGILVTVQCTTAGGTLCADYSTISGTLHPLATTASSLAAYPDRCSASNFDPTTDSLDGRYLFEVGACQQADPDGFRRPWTCTATVDPTTAPIDCNGIVTPVTGGFPFDGNGDDDHCDLGIDGPFPEGQPLGNLVTSGGCHAEPDPAPTTGSYTLLFGSRVNGVADGCSPHNDFAFGPDLPPPSGATRTPGYWKNHPGAISPHLGFEFCGEVVNDECSAVALLSSNGGGLKAFTRHGVAAYLNCQEYGCDSTLLDLVTQGSDACEAGTPFDYKKAANTLAAFNESGTGTGADPAGGKVDMHRCKRPRK